jgi:hypothetical protein
VIALTIAAAMLRCTEVSGHDAARFATAGVILTAWLCAVAMLYVAVMEVVCRE